MRALFCLTVTLVWLTTTGCDTDAGRTPGGAVVDTLVVGDTVVSTASELVGSATDLAIGPDGRLYVADYGFKRILSVRPDGTDPRMIGREGSGPGEFGWPMSIAIGSDTLWVFDAIQSRVQALAPDGRLFRSYDVAGPANGGGRTITASGQLAAAVGGRDSVLVAVLGGLGEALRSFGEPLVPPPTFFDFGSMKARIREGEIPAEFRNDGLPAWLEDGSVVLAFTSEPEIRRYGPDGALVWARPLEDPVLVSARAAFVRKNIEEQNPASIHTLRYVADVQEVGEEVWVLLNAEDLEDGVLLALDRSDGEVLRRLVLAGLPGAWAFAVDPGRERLYVSDRDMAMLVAFPLSR